MPSSFALMASGVIDGSALKNISNSLLSSVGMKSPPINLASDMEANKASKESTIKVILNFNMTPKRRS